ncbi:MAG: M28 family peptidase [Bacteroidetes bacterium]|nr:M28 family peptidase [Bacteroidota bacterium]
MHGRAPGTADEEKAAGYIALHLDAAECKLVFQQFPFEKDSALNVFGFLDFKKDSTIIISAHYDHLGYGTNKSREIIKKGIHHGADDNASGVAMMLELSQMLSNPLYKIRMAKYNYFFAAYSAHEAGLFGSAYFAGTKLCDSLKIRAVINFDMVGRLDTGSRIIRVSGVGTDSIFHSFFQQQDSMLHFRLDDEKLLQSDVKPFAEKGIPVLHVTTGVHEDYHRISDTADKINYSGLQNIFNVLHRLLLLINS